MTSPTRIILMDEALTADGAVQAYLDADACMGGAQRTLCALEGPVLIMQASRATLRDVAIEALFRGDFVTISPQVVVGIADQANCVLVGPVYQLGPKLLALVAAKAAP